jgi:organic radical activating enzyme
VVEVFSSVQGEGIYVGCRQIFVRFAGCNLACAYCDTAYAREEHALCRVEDGPGSGRRRYLPNPLTPDELADVLEGLSLHLHHSVSLTGGEPLLYPEFLRRLLPRVEGTRAGIYLETNGTLPAAMEAVLDLVDVVAMDVKLPSVTGLRAFWDLHRRFLELAARRTVFVKAVVGPTTTVSEVLAAAALVRDVAPAVPLVLQPVGPGGVPAAHLLELQAAALGLLDDVRVIPQTHSLMGLP